MPDVDILTLPVVPLTQGVVLPSMVVTIALETDEAQAAYEAAADGGRLLLVPRVDGAYARVGVVAQIESTGALPSGTKALVVRALHRATVRAGVVGATDALWLQAEPVTEPEPDATVRAAATELRATFRALFEHLGGRRLSEMLSGLDDPSALADAAGWWPDLSIERKVQLLETIEVGPRVQLVLGWAKEALGELELTERIRTEVSDGMEQRQREFLLRQQLAAIRKELGDDDEADPVEGFRERLEALGDTLPESVREAIEREIKRLDRTPDEAAEHGWIRTWLDTVFEVPWGERTDDHLDVDDARAPCSTPTTTASTTSRTASSRSWPCASCASTATSTCPAAGAAPPSSPSSALPGSARPASASPWPARSAASSSASRSAACTTRPRSVATGAPTSAPGRDASSGPSPMPAP